MKVSYADMNTPYKLILRNILYLSYYVLIEKEIIISIFL